MDYKKELKKKLKEEIKFLNKLAYYILPFGDFEKGLIIIIHYQIEKIKKDLDKLYLED